MPGINKLAVYLLGVIIISLPVILPLTKPGYFPSHDGEWAVVRLSEMHREIKDLQIPPRWSDFLNHGYGYPLFSFTYPLPYYVGELLHLTRIGLVDSVKFLFIISVVLSGFFMFFLGRHLDGDVAGLIAGALYMYAPFRLVDIYVRGSVGESLALVLFPLLFICTLKLIAQPSWLKVICTSLVLSALILTHNVMAVIFVPIWFIFFFVGVKYYFQDIRSYLRWIIPTFSLGLGISAYFWLPALVEKKFILLSAIPLADISQNFIRPIDFFNSPWTYGLIPSFQLGWVHILLFIIGIITLLTQQGIERKKNLLIGIYILLTSLGLMFMMLSASAPLWRLPLLSSVDFPWRLITPLTFFLSLGAIFAVDRKAVRYCAFFFIVVAFFLIPNFARPESILQKNDQYYQTNDATTTSADELMPLWVVNKPTNRYSLKVQGIRGRTTIDKLEFNSHSINFQIKSLGSSAIQINTIYFPGWEFTLDQNNVLINYNNAPGLIQLEIPDGQHEVEGQFRETPIRIWADIISLFSIILCALIILTQRVPQLRNRLLWKR